MKYFKHPSGFRNQRYPKQVLLNHGHEVLGYLFIILEVYAQHCDENTVGSFVSIDKNYLKYELQISHDRKLFNCLEKLISENFYQNLGEFREKFAQNLLKISPEIFGILYKIDGKKINVAILGFESMTDEWTRTKLLKTVKNSELTPSELRADSELDMCARMREHHQHHEVVLGEEEKNNSLLSSSCSSSSLPVSSDQNENKKIDKNEGKFFNINLFGESLTEDEWIFRCLRERMRLQGKSVMNADDLKALVSLYPAQNQPLYKRWILNPIAKRMAAFLVIHLDATPNDPLTYGINAMEKNWEALRKRLSQCEQSVSSGDYLINLG